MTAVLGRHGGYRPIRDSNAQADNVRLRQFGNSAAYLIARLKRDHPDIAERLARGEFPSARAVAIKARIIKPPKKRRRLSPGRNTSAHDLVMTPPDLAIAIVRHFRPSGIVLDPCRGHGAFYNALKLCPTVTEANWCEVDEGRDFFDEHRKVDWVVTNAPWSKLRAFLNHAMKISDNVVFLCTMTHFVTRARIRDIAEAGFAMREALLVPNPPPPWPGGGFQLAACWLQRGWTGGLTSTTSR